jgi:hypothetical protein
MLSIERRTAEATHPSKCNDIIIPPQWCMPTDLCVESQSEKQTRKNAKEPRHAQDHRPVVPIVHLVHSPSSNIRILAVIVPALRIAPRNILGLTPGSAHGRCAQTRDNTLGKEKRSTTTMTDTQRGYRARPCFVHVWPRRHQWRELPMLFSTCMKPRLSNQQFAATSPLLHVS